MAKKIKLALCVIVCGLAACWFGKHSGLIETVSAAGKIVLATGQTKVDFTRDIQPIFAANCYQCHSAKKASGQLRLDAKNSAMKGGISGVAILSGNGKDSRLVHRLLGLNDETRMPVGGQLKPEQIELINRWIDEGAVWPDAETVERGDAGNEPPKHWAFVAPKRPALPTVKNAAWAKTPIDNFILAEIEKHGLETSPEAAKEILIRRLSLDLTGLPPSLKEIDEFLADKSPQAYEKLVERLLTSPHYGERWGRWWLDAARYADTNGFEKDLPRSIWPYRDWVIKAFNKNMPFDQFTIEQLAGDLLPNATLSQKIATGFLRNSMLNQEGGVDPEQFRVEGLIDRVDAVGKAFLGLTVSCAQCHNHKFDPITQREYFQFYAFLNSDDEPEIEVPDEKVLKKRQEVSAKVAKFEDELIAKTPDWQKRLAEWEQTETSQPKIEWTPLTGGEIFAAFGVKFDNLEDGSFLAKGDNSTSNNYKVTIRTKLKNIAGFKLEFLTDPNLPRTGPGRAPDGSFYVSEFSVEAAPANNPDAFKKITLTNATTDFNHQDFSVENVIDGNPKTHWYSDAGNGRRNQDRQMVFATTEPTGFDEGTTFQFQLAQKTDETVKIGNVMPNIGRFRISVTTATNPKAEKIPANVQRLFAIAADKRTDAQWRELFSHYRTTVEEFADANKQIDEAMRDWPYGATTMSLAQRGVPRETRIFRRGDWKRPTDSVTPNTPAVLPSFPADAPRNRLGLANWIVAKENPLTSRVIVNRIWQQYFGAGLVSTPEDFGARCETPSHPELLDWLATEFIEKNWDVKHVHRLIVNSAMYRQSSKLTPKNLEADPTNKWLARAPRLRVESETVRDIGLTASGLLSRKIGGPSVYPPIPDGVLSLGYGAQMPWPTSTGADRYRRGMYTFWKRSVPYPSMIVFDQPNGDFTCTRRVRSNTPLQALTSLNDQLFMELAQGLALRVFTEGGQSDKNKIQYAFRLCTGRTPDSFETKRLLTLLDEQRKVFDGNTSAAVYVSAADLAKLPEKIDLHKLAPWTMVARVLLNLDETITRE
ncbi:MAG: PSD1 and planctomycete cytochrome C domain-containing protein [Acidobacteriota bacterium]|nr:PSD1 and planctomycete cytochrome C domain-containing protein [Acidobacteriota bacterium]